MDYLFNKEKQAEDTVKEYEEGADRVIALLKHEHLKEFENFTQRLQAVKAKVGRGLEPVKEYLLGIEPSKFGEVQRIEDELKTRNEEIQRRIKYALDNI
jgi:hypothetical protein